MWSRRIDVHYNTKYSQYRKAELGTASWDRFEENTPIRLLMMRVMLIMMVHMRMMMPRMQMVLMMLMAIMMLVDA